MESMMEKPDIETYWLEFRRAMMVPGGHWLGLALHRYVHPRWSIEDDHKLILGIDEELGEYQSDRIKEFVERLEEYWPQHCWSVTSVVFVGWQNPDWRGWEWFTLEDAYARQEPVQYIVEEMIELPSLNVIYGSPGSFKSFLMADMGLCVATDGEDWLPPKPGDESVRARKTEQVPVMWLDFDNGARRTHERIRALATARGLPTHIPFYYFCMPHPWLDMTNEQSAALLVEQILDLEAKLVFVDNLGTVSGGRDENSSEMIQVMSAFRQTVEATGAAIVLIHHETKAGASGRAGYRLRGHTSIEAALDLAILVEREERRPYATLSSTKSRGLDVYPFGAEFTYDNGIVGTTLEAAKFFGRSVEDSSNPVVIKRTILGVVQDSPNIKKTDLVNNAYQRLGEEVGLNRIDRMVRELVTDGKLVETEGERTAKHYTLP